MSTHTLPGVSTIEHLDFEPAIPCEHSLHASLHADEPAMFIVRSLCPNCGNTRDYALCLSGWELFGRVGAAFCTKCDHTDFRGRDAYLTILRVIGGPR